MSGMPKSRTSPYHPYGNGLTECMNIAENVRNSRSSKKQDCKSEVEPSGPCVQLHQARNGRPLALFTHVWQITKISH